MCTNLSKYRVALLSKTQKNVVYLKCIEIFLQLRKNNFVQTAGSLVYHTLCTLLFKDPLHYCIVDVAIAKT